MLVNTDEYDVMRQLRKVRLSETFIRNKTCQNINYNTKYRAIQGVSGVHSKDSTVPVIALLI